MARGQKHSPEEIVSLLRQIEMAVVNGKTTPAACREGGITDADVLSLAKKGRRAEVDQACRLKEFEQENAKLKWLVAELSLDKLVLKDIASGSF
jgi:putative transposase